MPGGGCRDLQRPGKGSETQIHQHCTQIQPSGILTAQPAEARPQDTHKCPLQHSAAPELHKGPGIGCRSIGQGVLSPHTREVIFFGGAGKDYIHLDLYWWFWSSSASVRVGRWAQEVGKQGQSTFNGAPFGLPSKDSSSINLIFLVTAYHCKRDHFLRKEKNKVMFSYRKPVRKPSWQAKSYIKLFSGESLMGRAGLSLMLRSSIACQGLQAAQQYLSHVPSPKLV